jgi:hypothetical protein
METTAIDPAAADEVRAEWKQAIEALMSDVRSWAEAEGWTVEPFFPVLSEEPLGTYPVPGLEILTLQGKVILEPIARLVMGAHGRVDYYAWPSLRRVMLLRKADGTWVVRTDFGPVWPNPWSRSTFVELAHGLQLELGVTATFGG